MLCNFTSYRNATKQMLLSTFGKFEAETKMFMHSKIMQVINRIYFCFDFNLGTLSTVSPPSFHYINSKDSCTYWAHKVLRWTRRQLPTVSSTKFCCCYFIVHIWNSRPCTCEVRGLLLKHLIVFLIVLNHFHLPEWTLLHHNIVKSIHFHNHEK